MRIELQDIRDFLAACVPFGQLPTQVLQDLPARLHINYLRRGSAFPPDDSARVYILRQGAVELRDKDDQLIDRLDEGGIYAFNCSEAASMVELHGAVSEDCLYYSMSCEQLTRLRESHEDVDRFFKASLRERLRHAINAAHDESAGADLHAEAGGLLKREPVCVIPTTSVTEAARVMSAQRVSSLLIADGENLLGIVTDRDLRKRCLAAGVDPRSPVGAIMTREPRTISPRTTVAEALLLMSQHNLHHLPVVDKHKILGMISGGDLLREQSSSPLHLIRAIHKSSTLEQLRSHARKIPEQQHKLLHAGAGPRQTGRILSAIADALSGKLFALAELELGGAPIPFCWFAIGSLARRELTAHSDQDNGLILSDAYDEARHGDYFARLAGFICDGLDACGFYYCPGEVMATNPEWRQPLQQWKNYFSRWVNTPEPKALLLACNFFDMRWIHGDDSLFKALQDHALAIAGRNKIFHAYLAGNAMQQHPPLGFFRRFVLIRGGEHDDTFDLKLRGLLPITDLARLFALVEGISAVNTYERLEAVAGSRSLSREGAENLGDALLLIAGLRLEHQAAQYRQGRDMDNYVTPAGLSQVQRNHLKDVFEAIRTVQDSVAQRYQTDRF